MERNKLSKGILLAACCVLAILSGCEYDGPSSIWTPDQQQAKEAPVINRVEPEDASGAAKIKLIGVNFSPKVEENFIYFNNVPARVKTASETEVTVYRPYIFGDSLAVRATVSGTLGIAKYYPYKLRPVSIVYGGFDELDFFYSIELDAEENLYAALNKTVVKVTPGGEKIEYGSMTFKITSGMRMGPGGYLYIQKKDDASIYRFDPGGGRAKVFARLSKAVAYFDFDENGNIFIGGNKSGLFVIHPDASVMSVGQYADFEIKSIRVFEGCVYVAAVYTGSEPIGVKSGVWKNEILSPNGDLADKELYLDWANAGDFSGSELNDITFSQQGDMYVATSNSDPILIVHRDGSSEPLYGGGFFTPSFFNLVWGNGKFIYVNRGSITVRELIRIEMDTQGAPYYGRR